MGNRRPNMPISAHREVCCVSGAQVRDITGELSSLVRPFDHHLLLLLQTRSDEIIKRSLRGKKRDFRALGQLVEGSGAQESSLVFPVTTNNIARKRQTREVNVCLQGWCQGKKFGFLGHGIIYPDGTHVSQMGKIAAAQELGGLSDRALN